MQNSTLPETFRPLLWSYDFSRIDPLKHKKTIILQALNYGTLAHWRWLVQSYGREGVRDVLTATCVARELRTISVAKLEPLEPALVNEARLRSIGCVVD